MFEKSSGGENNYGKKGEVVSQFSVQKILSHITEIFRRGTILCCVPEKSGGKKV